MLISMMTSLSEEQRRRLLDLLIDCSLKLRMYREQHSGNYVGGVEYTELQRRIHAEHEALR